MHKRFSHGFTLVELAIVITVIAILAGIITNTFKGVQERGHNTAVQTDMTKIADELNIYYGDKGRYPTSAAELGTINGVRVTRNSYETATQDAFTYCVETGSTPGSAMALVAWSKGGDRFVLKDEATVKKNVAVNNACTSVKSSYATIAIHSIAGGWMTNF